VAERALAVCDLDNEPTISVAQVRVTVDGKERTFDLCDKHLAAFSAAIAPFSPGGAGRGRGRGAAKKTTAKKTAAKKTVAKKTVAKKTVAKKTTAKATVAKAGPGRPAKKATAKATVAKRPGRPAKKATAKATVAKRPGRPAKATGRTAAAGASNTAAVRAWARSQGIAVPERGRLGRDLIERYQAANG
jgi:Lsr2 protein